MKHIRYLSPTLLALLAPVILRADVVGQDDSQTGSRQETDCAAVLAELDSLAKEDLEPNSERALRDAMLRRVVVDDCVTSGVPAPLRARALLVAAEGVSGSDVARRRALLLSADEILISEAPRTTERILVQEALSSVEFQRGDYDAARGALEGALELRRDFYGTDSPQAVDGMVLVGYGFLAESEVRKREVNLGRAQAMFEEATGLATMVLGETAPATRRAWLALSALHRARGNAEEANRISAEHVEGHPEDLDRELPPVPPSVSSD